MTQAWLALPLVLLLPRLASGASDSTMTSGGLAPPPAVEPAPTETAPTPTEQELSRAAREDAGRGLEFVWLNAEAGFQHVGLQTFHGDKLVDKSQVESVQSGPLFGVGAGVRLIFLTAGARFRLGTFGSWQLWTLGAEFGYRIPLGSLEPHFGLGGGYASLGKLDAKDGLRNAGLANGELGIHGFNVRGSVGLDYYFSSAFSLGANLAGDFLFLSRSKKSAGATTAEPTDQATAAFYAEDASSIGGALSLTAVAGLHF